MSTKPSPAPWVSGYDPCHFDAPEIRNHEHAIYIPDKRLADEFCIKLNHHERLVSALKEVCNHVVTCERGGASSLELTQVFSIAEQALLELEQEEK